MRPVDGQRLPSAHLQFSLLFSRRIGYLHLSRIFRHFKSSYHNTVRENRPSGRRFSIPLPGSVIRLIRPFQGFTGARLVQSSRKGRSLHKVITSLLRAPPRGIPGYSLLSGGRLLAGDRHCALVCIPPARHRIFCPSAFRYPLAHDTTGHWHRVSPALFPNAGIPTASPAESFRLSERFSSRLCTEIQDEPEELVTLSNIQFSRFMAYRSFLFLSCQYRVSSFRIAVIKPVR